MAAHDINWKKYTLSGQVFLPKHIALKCQLSSSIYLCCALAPLLGPIWFGSLATIN